MDDIFSKCLSILEFEQAHALEQIDLAEKRRYQARVKRDIHAERLAQSLSDAHREWAERLEAAANTLKKPVVRTRGRRSRTVDDSDEC